jgi:hypothetical protein
VLREDRPSALRSGLKLGLALLIVVAGFPLARDLAGLLDGLGNPFGSDHDERVDAAVLTALSDLDELHAATAELQVVVEIEDDTRFLPDVLSGRQTTFLAAGSVDAVVDLGDAAVAEKDDGTVVVTLPAPRLGEPAIDHDRSDVLDRDRGALDRVADAFGEPDDDGDLYRLASRELLRSAGETALLEQAEASARSTVEELLDQAGIGDVVVVFAEPAGIAA